MADQAEAMKKLLAGAAPKRGRRWVIAALGLVLVAGLGLWLWLGGQDSAVSYTTEAVERGDLVVIVTATGTVQPTTEVEVSSELSGTLATVEVDYNDAVAVGQVLAQLDTTKLQAQVANAEASLAGAKARVAQAQATVQESAAEYRRAVELDRRGITSQTSLDTSAATDARAKAALQSAEADLTLAEANLSLQRADLETATIRSPIRGIVLDRAAEPGQIVASSLSAPVLFTLAEDLSRMELQVDIDEADIGQVVVGNQADFTVEAYQGRKFPAEITQLRYAPEETDGVVTYKGVLRVDNSEGLLRPGMTATADITVKRVEAALSVPNAALRYTPPQTAASTSGSRSGSGLLGMLMPRTPAGAQSSGSAGSSVWVLRGGVPVEVPVVAGDSDGKRTELREGEIAEGDLVITDQTGAE